MGQFVIIVRTPPVKSGSHDIA